MEQCVLEKSEKTSRRKSGESGKFAEIKTRDSKRKDIELHIGLPTEIKRNKKSFFFERKPNYWKGKYNDSLKNLQNFRVSKIIQFGNAWGYSHVSEKIKVKLTH